MINRPHDLWSASRIAIRRSRQLIAETRRRILESAARVEASRQLLTGEPNGRTLPFETLWRDR